MGLIGKILGRERKEAELSLEERMDKVREYVSEMPDMASVSEFRAATARSIAAHNEMKLDAREHPNPELFELLMPFSEYFLKKVTKSAFDAAQAKAVEIELSVKCFDGGDVDIRPLSFYYSKEQGSAVITVHPSLRVHDISYEFEKPIEQWQYYYQLAHWLVGELDKKGFDHSPVALYVTDSDGWNNDMDRMALRIRWGDDLFIDSVKKFNDTSQVDAYLAGVPIEDIVA